uniref:Uncharacterized protein n=1 Tax=Laticauda laticaudata TaxID=8630 RepID=A0A8C5RGK2_LATLA
MSDKCDFCLSNSCYLISVVQEQFIQTKRIKKFVDCYDSVKGSAHDYGALSLTGEYITFQNYVGKYILFVNVATY